MTAALFFVLASYALTPGGGPRGELLATSGKLFGRRKGGGGQVS